MKFNTYEAVVQAQAQTQTETEIMRSKPEPTEAPAQVTPGTSEQTNPPMTAEVTPTPQPETTQVQPAPAPTPQVAPPSTMSEEKREKPTKLPKTASPLDLIGLMGLLSMSGGFKTQFLRR